MAHTPAKSDFDFGRRFCWLSSIEATIFPSDGQKREKTKKGGNRSKNRPFKGLGSLKLAAAFVISNLSEYHLSLRPEQISDSFP